MCIDTANPSITDWITAIAACAAALVAIFGLSTWRKQMSGTAEFELARTMLKSVYKLRNALQDVRNPFLSVAEAGDDFDEKNWEVTAYRNRWKNVQEALVDYEAMLLKAEVFWGSAVNEARSEMRSRISEIYGVIDIFIRAHHNKAFAQDLSKQHDLLYRIDDNDEYSKLLTKAVENFESIAKPHFRKRK